MTATHPTQGTAAVCEAFDVLPDTLFLGTKKGTLKPTYDLVVILSGTELVVQGAHTRAITSLEYVVWN